MRGETGMKKVNKLLHLVLGFSAGVLAGAFIRLGFEIIDGRPAAIGGEALILPLVILLVASGSRLGKRSRRRDTSAGFMKRGTGGAITRGWRTGRWRSTATLMCTTSRRNFKSGVNERLGLRPRP